MFYLVIPGEMCDSTESGNCFQIFWPNLPAQFRLLLPGLIPFGHYHHTWRYRWYVQSDETVKATMLTPNTGQRIGNGRSQLVHSGLHLSATGALAARGHCIPSAGHLAL